MVPPAERVSLSLMVRFPAKGRLPCEKSKPVKSTVESVGRVTSPVICPLGPNSMSTGASATSPEASTSHDTGLSTFSTVRRIICIAENP